MDAAIKIIDSVVDDNLADVAKKLNSGISVDIQDDDGVTPLHAAAVYGHNDLIKFLLSKSANIDLTNNYGWTALMLAAKHGHSSTISVLLKNRARVNISNKFGMTSLAAAVWSGQTLCVKLLLEAGAIVGQVSVGHYGQAEDLTPVMISAMLGHVAILQMLLGKGAPANHVSTVTGWTPLMLAACNGHKQAVQILIEWGANVQATDCRSRTALDVAEIMHHHDVEVLLRTVTTSRIASRKETELLEAVRNENSALVALILKEDKASANSVDILEGVSALMIASTLGSLDIVRSLINGGANVNTQSSNDGWTALMYAAFNKHYSIVSYLLENGADATTQSHHGYTVLDLVNHIDYPRDDIVQALKLAVNEWRPDIVCTAATRPFLTMNSYCKKNFQTSRSQNLLNVSLPSTSTLKSPTESLIFDDKVSETDMNDEVFNEQFESDSGEMLCLNMSELRLPERFLANNLKKHFPVIPPLLSRPRRTRHKKEETSPQKQQKKSPKPCRVLRLPNLLKTYVQKSTKVSKMEERIDSVENSMRLLPSRAFSDDVSSKCLHSPARVLKENPATTIKKNEEQSLSFIKKLELNDQGSISQIIKDESLQKHVQKMKDEEIDIGAFKYLTEEDMDELGVETLSSREMLLELATKLKNK